MTISLTADAQARLDAHLDAVERALAAAGKSRDERRGIADDLEAQILDMLSARSATPTLADLESVLANLDPPRAYGESTGAPIGAVMPRVPAAVPASEMAAAALPPRPRYSRAAIAGLICILMSLLPIPVLGGIAYLWVSAADHSGPRSVITAPPALTIEPAPFAQPAPIAATQASPPYSSEPDRFNSLFSMIWCPAAVLGPLGLAGTILGWVAFGHIHSGRGALRGMGMALFDGLFYPILFIVFIMLTLA